jgi:hypothetical protein
MNLCALEIGGMTLFVFFRCPNWLLQSFTTYVELLQLAMEEFCGEFDVIQRNIIRLCRDFFFAIE